MATHEFNYEGIDARELVEQLKEAETLHEQADIIHYLFTHMYEELPLHSHVHRATSSLTCMQSYLFTHMYSSATSSLTCTQNYLFTHMCSTAT